MKILGIVLIVLGFGSMFWCAVVNHQNKGLITGIGLIAIFVGVFSVLNYRVTEFTINNIGTIKAAADQATTDANAIAELRKRIESQSATIDIVAQSAQKAHKFIEELRETAEFTSLVAAAQNDDRAAFEELLYWVNKKESKYWQHAADTVVRIRTNYGGPIEPGYMNISWPKEINPKKLSIKHIKENYQKTNRIYKTDLVNTVRESDAIIKKDKMQFFANILKKDNSLHATFYAGKYFVELASDPNLKWNPFSTTPLLNWWAAHKSNFDTPN
jgi:hypothetical protein